jgi:molecular chaperone DnaK
VAVTAEAVGIETAAGPFIVVLPRGTAVPVSYSQVYSTRDDDQPAVQVTLLAGDPSQDNNVRTLSTLVVFGLRPTRRGVLQIPISVIVDEHGAVTVTPRHPGTGEVSSVAAGMVALSSYRGK